MIPTLCRDCEWVEAGSRKLKVYQWLCSRHKRLGPSGFVDPEWWTKGEPFLRCQDVNAGACPLFEPKKGETE